MNMSVLGRRTSYTCDCDELHSRQQLENKTHLEIDAEVMDKEWRWRTSACWAM